MHDFFCHSTDHTASNPSDTSEMVNDTFAHRGHTRRRRHHGVAWMQGICAMLYMYKILPLRIACNSISFSCLSKTEDYDFCFTGIHCWEAVPTHAQTCAIRLDPQSSCRVHHHCICIIFLNLLIMVYCVCGM